MSTRLAVCIPQAYPNGSIDPDRIRRYLSRVEELGFFDGVWVQDQTIGQMPTLDPLELLTFAAACTRHLKLGCAVWISGQRNPIHLAKSLGTLDQLSQGRLIVGVGLGYPRLDRTFGVDPATRVAHFSEGLQVMKALWTEEKATFHGRFWQLEAAPMEPKPVQKPHPPIWFGAHHPNALKRTVQLGDGFIGAGSSSIAQFRQEIVQLRALLEEAKRDPAAFPLSKRVYIAVDPNRDRAMERLRSWFNLNYGRPEMAEEVCVRGSRDECAEQLRAIASAGAELIVLTPLFDEDEHLEEFASLRNLL